MPYIGNITSDFSIDTGNITNRAVTALKLSPSSVGSNGQVLSVDGSGNLQWSTDAALTLIDEDNMSSNSASSVPSQQSVKAYADTKAVLTGSTNNTITTVTAANALQGEASLTYDGSELKVLKSSGAKITLENTGNAGVALTGDADRSGADDYIFSLDGKWNGTSVAAIRFESGADTTNKDDGIISFWTAPAGTKSERLRIDSSGHIGQGVTPKTWSLGKALNVGYLENVLHGESGDGFHMVQNAYYNSGWKKVSADLSSIYTQWQGTHIFYTNATGSADDAITWQSRLKILATGEVGIGTTSPESLLSVDGSVAISSNGVAVTPSGYDLKIRSNTSKLGIHCDTGAGTPSLEFGTGGATGCFITNLDNTPMRFGTQNTERMRITGTGDVNIGNVGGTAAHHASGLFNGVTPKFEVKLGAAANSYTRYINIMNPGAQTGSETLGRVGIKLSLGSEASSSESNKSGAIYAESTSGYNNGTALCFGVGNSERFRIASTGEIQIKNTENPANYNMKDIMLGAHDGNHGLTILSGTSSGGYIMFSDNNGGGTNAYRGQIEYNHNGDYMRWITDAGERMRITAGGALGINTSTPQQASHPSIHLHGSQNDDARIAITTPNKPDGRIGYYGLSNRFGIDMYNGFQIRDVADSYATRILIASNGDIGVGTESTNSRLTINGGSSQNVLSVRNTTTGNGNVGILFSTQDHSGGREKVAIYHQETHGTAHYAGDLVYCMNNATGGATQVSISDERFRMKRDGRFEIKATNTGTAYDEPLLKVQLTGDSTSDKTFISLWNGSATGDISTETSHIDFVWQDSNANVKPQARISGNVGDGSDSNSTNKEGKGYLTFHCSNTAADDGDENPPERLKIAHDGTFSGSGSNNISDQRLKENIATITDATTKIKALTGRTFTWKAEANMQEGTKYGFIAQEVEPIVSDLVCDWTGIRVLDKDGQITKQLKPDKSKGDSYAKSVNVEGVIPILVEALKEALTEIDTLKTKVAALESA